jgi:arylsulfate sulfotransferase
MNSSLTFTQEPRLALNPTGRTPSTAVIELATSAPTTISLSLRNQDCKKSIDFTRAVTEHRIPVLGLLPYSDAEVEITLKGENGDTLQQTFHLTTPPLPDAFPNLDVRCCEAKRREPGYMITTVGRAPRAIKITSPFEAVIALDQKGAPAWYYLSEVCLMAAVPTERNTLFLMTTDGRIREINYLGETIAEWYSAPRFPDGCSDSIPVQTEKFHHAVAELDNGNLLALSVEFVEYDDIPDNSEDRNPPRSRHTIAGDTLVEFKRNGEIVREISFIKQLDPQRIGWGMHSPFWPNQGFEGVLDWSHANGIALDPKDGGIVVTIRHQDAVVKFDRETGNVVWILGTDQEWRKPWSDLLLEPEGNLDWFWHPHDPSFTATGNLMMFDNGAFGSVAPNPRIPLDDCLSRSVQYRIDEDTRTVTQEWSFGGNDLPYAEYVSGARECPETGNIFVTYGGILKNEAGDRVVLPPDAVGEICYFEVTSDAEPEILFELAIQDPEATIANGWAAFKAEYIKDFY